MNSYRDVIHNKNIILLDGGMGTLLQKQNLTLDDFNGYEGLNELLNISQPAIIKGIHTQYLEAGAQAIETNTFGGSRIKLKEYGLSGDTAKLNTAGAQCARQAVDAYRSKTDRPLFVVGSMGPTGKLPSSTDPILGKISFDELSDVFEEQARSLIQGGVDVLLLETQHDILEVKAAIHGCLKAIEQSDKEIALQVQITVDGTGKMLYGTDVLTALTILNEYPIDVVGMNCSTGPYEMTKAVKAFTSYSLYPVSVVPNAGMPENVNGQAVYGLSEQNFAKQVAKFVSQFGVQVVGGCCGTTPGHIRALRTLIDKVRLPERKPGPLPYFASPIAPVQETNVPVIIGERINSQGSRKAKELMLNDDYDSLKSIALTQQQQGAPLIDLCFAMTERQDEGEQMATFIKQIAYSTTSALVIDSTEASVIEAALKQYAGKALINSINLESDKIHALLPLIRDFHVSTIALCIDKKGMATTAKRKTNIAERIYRLAVDRYNIPPHRLIFDPLTFSLATGDKQYRDSALQTFQALKDIKIRCPGAYTVLGASNVSFGLSPEGRKVLNIVYLEEAVKHGLDYAIFNPAHIISSAQLDPEAVKLARALIYNNSDDALIKYVQYFENRTSPKQPASRQNSTVIKDIKKVLRNHILKRSKDQLKAHIDEALKEYSPTDIITHILLPAMKTVGDMMDRGEIILPFVLESAEVMKASIAYLERFLDKNTDISKGTIVLATVYGDVHDIGKNLVKTILENNGYKVIDLGKQVPVGTIIETAVQQKADAISLSALLVTTSKQMRIVVEKCAEQGLNIPIIIGGAAINDSFATHISTPFGTPYPGKVYYSKDAFEGLKIINGIIDERSKNH